MHENVAILGSWGMSHRCADVSGDFDSDTIDGYMNHAGNSLERVAYPEWPEFVAAAKAQGKIRFCGMSGHGGRLAECVAHAIEPNLSHIGESAVFLVGKGQIANFLSKISQAAGLMEAPLGPQMTSH